MLFQREKMPDTIRTEIEEVYLLKQTYFEYAFLLELLEERTDEVAISLHKKIEIVIAESETPLKLTSSEIDFLNGIITDCSVEQARILQDKILKKSIVKFCSGMFTYRQN